MRHIFQSFAERITKLQIVLFCIGLCVVGILVTAAVMLKRPACLEQAIGQQTIPSYQYDGLEEITIRTVMVEPAQQAVGLASSCDMVLPNEWVKSKSIKSGHWRYRFQVMLPTGMEIQPTVMYIPRVGNRYAVSLNGVRLAQKGELAVTSHADYSRQPQLVALPSQLFQSTNEMVIDVYGDSNRYAGLSSIQIGPQSITYEKFRQREVVQFWLLYAILGIAVFFMLLTIGLSLATQERVFALFGLACVFAGIRILSYLLVNPPLPYPWWIWLVETSHVAFIVFICLFSYQFIGLHKKTVLISTGLMSTIALVGIPLFAFFEWYRFRQYVTFSLLIYGTLIAVMAIGAWYRRRDTPSATLALAGVLSIAVGLYDHVLVFYSQDGYSSFTLSRFALIFFLLAMGHIIVWRFANRAQIERRLRKSLAVELNAKSLALNQEFQQKQVLLQAQAQNKERERIVRDIHDGMGLHLSGILGLLDASHLDRRALDTEVRTALDHMRLLVNNSETFEGDWLMLFGTLRHNIETRLQRFHIALVWSMPFSDMPTIEVSALHATALQRLFFELTTNVIKHSQATRVMIAISYTDPDAAKLGQFNISFLDDGIGFVPAARKAGLGQRSVAHRVIELGATLDVQSQQGQGVGYLLQIPVANSINHS